MYKKDVMFIIDKCGSISEMDDSGSEKLLHFFYCDVRLRSNIFV